MQIPRHLVNQILHLAQLSPDQEISGLIGGRDNIPRSCYPVPVAEAGDLRLDPKGCRAALNAMAARDETLIAVLHTHPNAPAVPGSGDPALPEFPAIPCLIVSLNTKGVLEMRGYRSNSARPTTEFDLELTE